MINKFPVKIFAIAVPLLLAWLWYSANSSDESQEDKAVLGGLIDVQAQKKAVKSESPTSLVVKDLVLDEALAKRFHATTQLIEQGNKELAISELNEIIRLQPNAIEPYINLAALYAKTQDVEQASETLKKAIRVHENTSVLFDSLQKVYAAQASLAYQRALEIKTIEDDSLAINLPVIDTITVNKPSDAELELRQQIADGAKRIDALEQNLDGLSKEKESLVALNTQLKSQVDDSIDPESFALLQAQIASLKSTHAERLAQLELQSETEVSVLKKQIDQNAQTIASLGKADSEASQLALEVTELKKQIDQKTSVIASLEQNNVETSDAQKRQSELEISELKKQLDQQASTILALKKTNSESSQTVLEISALKKQLDQQNSTILALKKDSSASSQLSEENLALKQQLAEQASTIALLEKANAEASQLALLASAKATENTVAQIDAQLTESSSSQASEGSLPAEGSLLADGSKTSGDEKAIALVRAWASSWAAQDVAAYIDYYQDGYRPSNGLSNKQWREQRQVRLTNKSYINVDVSNFTVKDLGAEFSVKFLQHYKSNNVDDKIFKTLVFAKNSDDWAQAKIIQEQVTTN